MRNWIAGGAGGSSRMKLANYFNRQLTDHVSTHEWDGTGDHQWRWALTDASAREIQCATRAQSRLTRSSSA